MRCRDRAGLSDTRHSAPIGSNQRPNIQEWRAVRVIMIKCPQTGEEVSTGIVTTASSHCRLPDTFTFFRCPACGSEHGWWKWEARLDPSNLPSTQPVA